MRSRNEIFRPTFKDSHLKHVKTPVVLRVSDKKGRIEALKSLKEGFKAMLVLVHEIEKGLCSIFTWISNYQVNR